MLPCLVCACELSNNLLCVFCSVWAIVAQGVWVLSGILALKCAQVQGEELLREFNDKVRGATCL